LGIRVRRIQLRTKFFLALLGISAGLTAATLLIVEYSVRTQVRAALREQLDSSVRTYEVFEKQREETSTRSAQLIANLPYLRALMTTRDPTTIEDASIDIWRWSRSDLLVLADTTGKMAALRTNSPGVTR
jgi:hypothetical protein